jgi:hypothetical protein
VAKIETTEEDIKDRIREVLRGCPDGRGMDKDSLHAACLLSAEIEDMQAALRLLQRGEITGSVDADGEVLLCANSENNEAV